MARPCLPRGAVDEHVDLLDLKYSVPWNFSIGDFTSHFDLNRGIPARPACIQALTIPVSTYPISNVNLPSFHTLSTLITARSSDILQQICLIVTMSLLTSVDIYFLSKLQSYKLSSYQSPGKQFEEWHRDSTSLSTKAIPLICKRQDIPLFSLARTTRKLVIYSIWPALQASLRLNEDSMKIQHRAEHSLKKSLSDQSPTAQPNNS
ncbi:hypothetical protein, variant [Exophiala dermatitidis NIH/UT8656]|uniref:Uncharacterized protein n=1 Tax=Exophiala dermatitidis (strain ATCC 34100 / CBS 525.76 / NIH/UT8656) TaxID=858893 RepID=H6CBC9_EXODN|nr:uncharacterized protein HMPREF1120_09015 [Exophiala dermatitidis NIH/UT8656]XP_009161538.1 hypothetical protein, variant [Exophiala dermatitidis NIH/UT8656]EHY61076.1 hypothetical protein, variant [Exophiala dermatitidis NIH/UT8656]EHY61077.1 hypothetical protein HMPREF1120_09015 [Exophiala dermatitidis NIH/UT8656]